MRTKNSRKIRKAGGMLTLIGFALGIAFGVVFVLSIIEGQSIGAILSSLLPVAAMGLLFSIAGLALRGYQHERPNQDPLLDIPVEDELELDYFPPERQKEKTRRERKAR